MGFVHGRAVADMSKARFIQSHKLARLLYDRLVNKFGGISSEGVQKRIFGSPFDLLDSEEYAEFEAATTTSV